MGERSRKLGRCGVIYGLDTAGNRFHLVRSSGELIEASITKGGPDERRAYLHRQARSAFSTLPKGARVFCEEPISLQNGETTRILGLAAGAIWAAHLYYDLFWFWVNISTWKREVIGKGNASKADVAAYWNKQGIYCESQDEYDARTIARYGEKAIGDG